MCSNDEHEYMATPNLLLPGRSSPTTVVDHVGVKEEVEEVTNVNNFLLKDLPFRKALPDKIILSNDELKARLAAEFGNLCVLVYRSIPNGDLAVVHLKSSLSQNAPNLSRKPLILAHCLFQGVCSLIYTI